MQLDGKREEEERTFWGSWWWGRGCPGARRAAAWRRGSRCACRWSAARRSAWGTRGCRSGPGSPACGCRAVWPRCGTATASPPRGSSTECTRTPAIEKKNTVPASVPASLHLYSGSQSSPLKTRLYQVRFPCADGNTEGFPSWFRRTFLSECPKLRWLLFLYPLRGCFRFPFPWQSGLVRS